ncbi:MAG: M48 family metallopeptidase [Candidatus Saccharibacteria bacterium]
MAVKQITIPEIGQVTMYKRRGNRSLRLSVAADGEVRVSLPYWVPYKAAEEFVKGKARWIANNKHVNPDPIAHGQYIGKNHRIYFTAEEGRTTVSTRVYNTEIYVMHPLRIDPTDSKVQSRAHAAGIRALKQEAERLLPDRLNQLATEHFFSYKNVGVKQLKSRWGSCSSQKEITLNLFLMQLPWHLIDYVLLHELTHTKVMRHGPPFWAELEEHLPNARELRQEINTYQPVLTPRALTMA